jgi:hypothetical protein
MLCQNAIAGEKESPMTFYRGIEQGHKKFKKAALVDENCNEIC